MRLLYFVRSNVAAPRKGRRPLLFVRLLAELPEWWWFDALFVFRGRAMEVLVIFGVVGGLIAWIWQSTTAAEQKRIADIKIADLEQKELDRQQRRKEAKEERKDRLAEEKAHRQYMRKIAREDAQDNAEDFLFWQEHLAEMKATNAPASVIAEAEDILRNHEGNPTNRK